MGGKPSKKKVTSFDVCGKGDGRFEIIEYYNAVTRNYIKEMVVGKLLLVRASHLVNNNEEVQAKEVNGWPFKVKVSSLPYGSTDPTYSFSDHELPVCVGDVIDIIGVPNYLRAVMPKEKPLSSPMANMETYHHWETSVLCCHPHGKRMSFVENSAIRNHLFPSNWKEEFKKLPNVDITLLDYF